MSFSITPSTFILSQNNIFDVFDHTFNVTYDDPEEPDTVTSVTITADIQENTVTLTNGSSSCSVSGYYTGDIFPNKTLTYISEGSSDLIETPIMVNRFDKVPDESELISFTPDPSLFTIITYTVIATTAGSLSATYNFTKYLYQSYDEGRDFIQERFN